MIAAGASPCETAADCFDADLAEYPTALVGVDQLVDLLHLTHAPERVRQYRLEMQQGQRFPPISVVRLGGRLFVADGHKRLTAYKALGRCVLPVEVWTRRRWLADQWRQLVAQTRRQWRVLIRTPVDPRARADATCMARDLARHWRRIGRSLWTSGSG